MTLQEFHTMLYLIEISVSAWHFSGALNFRHALWNLSDPNKQFHLMHET